MAKKASFEERLRELENMTSRLSGGDLPLEESMKLYEQGMTMAKALEKELREHRLRIEQIDPETGEISPFEVEA